MARKVTTSGRTAHALRTSSGSTVPTRGPMVRGRGGNPSASVRPTASPDLNLGPMRRELDVTTDSNVDVDPAADGKTNTSAARVEANRRNARKSTGPRTDAGKARAARNAARHGLAAECMVVAPVEDVKEYQARMAAWKEHARPVGPIEEALIARACHAAWRLERAARQEAAVLRQRANAAAVALEQLERARAVGLGERLLRDPINRCATPQLLNPSFAAKVADWKKDDPAVLAFELERTAQGVAWKRERWGELLLMLDREGFWHYDARYKALKLMGRRPEDVLFDPVVERVTLACHLLHPEPWDLIEDCHQATTAAEGRPVYYYRVDRLRTRQFPDKGAALAALYDLAWSEIARLDALLENDRGPKADAARDGAAERALHRSLAEFEKLRKARPDHDGGPIRRGGLHASAPIGVPTGDRPLAPEAPPAAETPEAAEPPEPAPPTEAPETSVSAPCAADGPPSGRPVSRPSRRRNEPKGPRPPADRPARRRSRSNPG